MMLEKVYPINKADLVRAIQKMPIKKIEVIDGYVTADERDLVKAAKAMSQGSGDLTIIIIKS